MAFKQGAGLGYVGRVSAALRPCAPKSPLAWLFDLMLVMYQLMCAPWLGGQCLFKTSCSTHARDLLRTETWPKALYEIVRRLLTCHPWHPLHNQEHRPNAPIVAPADKTMRPS